MAIINGTAIANLLNGTTQADTITGLEGDDTINGGVGRDTIYGGADNDLIDGGTDNDFIDGGTGNDRLLGNSGNDSVIGGTGNDTLDGSSGDDTLIGGEGNESINGGSGNDLIYGDNTSARPTGSVQAIDNGSFEDFGVGFTLQPWGRSNSTIPGWTLNGGPTFEIVDSGHRGVSSSDGLFWLDMDATAGNIDVSQIVDGLTVGTNYTLTFDAANTPTGNAMEVYFGNALVATVTPASTAMESFSFNVVGGSGDGSNTLRFLGTGPADNVGVSLDNVSLFSSLAVTDVTDSINGGSGDDTIYAGEGDDTANGESGNDKLYGQDGNDILTDNSGNDLLDGGAGNDTLTDNSGNDTLIGGTGNDTLTGGGGTGRDVFVFASGDGADVVTDFNNGLDKIALTGLGANFAAISAGISQVGLDAVVDFGAGGSITLLNTNIAVLDATDFTFA